MGTTAEKLEYLNTTKQLIKESINLTDANITTEPFRQYATILKHKLPEIVGDPSIIWNNYEHVTGTGTSFSVSAYNSIIDYSLKGDTTQNGTPTPTAPVTINTVTGDQVISVSDGTNTKSFEINLGKNLFNISLKPNSAINYDNGFTLLKSTNRTITISLPQMYEKGTYTLSYEIHNSNLTGLGKLGFWLQNEKSGGTTNVVGGNDNTTHTFLLNATDDFDRIYFYIASDQADTATISINNIQLEKGSSKTSYSAYFTPIELCKIGTYQDKIYKQNGKWYLYKEIGKVVLNGSESWNLTETSINTYRFVANNSLSQKALDYLVANFKNNYFKEFEGNNGISYPVDENGIAIRNDLAGITIRLAKTIVSDLATFKTWLSNNNTIVYYVLATPTTTEITNGSLIYQLNALSLYTGTNTITVSGNLPATLDLTAIKYS